MSSPLPPPPCSLPLPHPAPAAVDSSNAMAATAPRHTPSPSITIDVGDTHEHDIESPIPTHPLANTNAASPAAQPTPLPSSSPSQPAPSPSLLPVSCVSSLTAPHSSNNNDNKSKLLGRHVANKLSSTNFGRLSSTMNLTSSNRSTKSLSILRFSYLIIVVTLIMVLLCCFVVWLITYNRASSTVGEMSGVISNVINQLILSRTTTTLTRIVKSLALIDESILVRLPLFDDQESVLDMAGFLSPLASVYAHIPELANVAIANHHGVMLSVSAWQGISEYTICDRQLFNNNVLDHNTTGWSSAVYRFNASKYYNSLSPPLSDAARQYFDSTVKYGNVQKTPDFSHVQNGSEIMHALGAPVRQTPPLRHFDMIQFKHAIEFEGKLSWIVFRTNHSVELNNSLSVVERPELVLAAVIGHMADNHHQLSRIAYAEIYASCWTPIMRDFKQIGAHGIAVLAMSDGLVLSTNLHEFDDTTLALNEVNIFNHSHPLLDMLRPLLVSHGFIMFECESMMPVYSPSVLRLEVGFRDRDYHMEINSLHVNGINMFLVIMTTDSDFNDDLQDTKITTIWFSLLVGVVCIIVSILMTHCILRPIARLVAFMEHISIRLQRSKGDLNKQEIEIKEFIKVWHANGDESSEQLHITNKQWLHHQFLKQCDQLGCTNNEKHSHSPSHIKASLSSRSSFTHICSSFASFLSSIIPTIPFRENQLLHRAFGSMLNGLQSSHAQLQSANESKRRFIRYIFHEVRVPFNAIVLGVEQLRDDLYTEPLKPVEEMRDVADILDEQSKVVARILNDVLSLQKIEDGALKLDFAPFSMVDMIIGTINTYQPLLDEKQLTLVTRLENFTLVLEDHLRQWLIAHRSELMANHTSQKASLMPAIADDDTPPTATRVIVHPVQQASSPSSHRKPTLPNQPSTELAGDQLTLPPSPVHDQMDEWLAIQFAKYLHLTRNKALLGDVYRLRQVLANFLSNSIKFTPRFGQVTVNLNFHFPTDDPAVVNAAGDSSTTTPLTWSPPKNVIVRVSVSDTGKGLNQQEQLNMFKPYIQLSPNEQQQGKGTGLGLNISKSLIELHGGNIGVESSGVVGEGAEFFFELPLSVVTSDTAGQELLMSSRHSVSHFRTPVAAVRSLCNSPAMLNRLTHLPMIQGARHTNSHFSSPFAHAANHHSTDWTSSTSRKPVQILNNPSPHLQIPAHPNTATQNTIIVVPTSQQPRVKSSSRVHVETRSESSLQRHNPRSTGPDVDNLTFNDSVPSSSSPSLSFVPSPPVPTDSLFQASTINTTPHSASHTSDRMDITDALSNTSTPLFHTRALLPSSHSNVSYSPNCRKDHQSDSITSAAAVTPPRVLVVEDSAPNRKLLLMLLRSLGCDAVGLDDGLQAVREFEPAATSDWSGPLINGGRHNSKLDKAQQAEKAKYDLILMDGNMPVMNGMDAVRNIRALGFTLPIVAVTGNALEDDVEAFLRAGCNHLLKKPIVRTELESCLATFIAGFTVPPNMPHGKHHKHSAKVAPSPSS